MIGGFDKKWKSLLERPWWTGIRIHVTGKKLVSIASLGAEAQFLKVIPNAEKAEGRDPKLVVPTNLFPRHMYFHTCLSILEGQQVYTTPVIPSTNDSMTFWHDGWNIFYWYGYENIFKLSIEWYEF